MTNKEQKKINDKKYIRKNVIVALIGVMIFAILICTIQPKAADKDDLQYIPFGQFELVNTVDDKNVYKITLTKPLQDITLALIMIDPTGAGVGGVFYDEDSNYVTQERFVKDTSYQDIKYNAYRANCIYIIKSITITVSANLVIDGLYIIPNNTSVDYNTVISNKLSQLNVQKYIVQTIDIGYDEFNSIYYDSSIIYPYEIYLNQQSRLLFISGQVAITGGVNKYIYTVNNSTPNEITNNNTGQSVTSDFITEVNNANFGITDYNNNANFDFGIVLLSYENQTVSVTISAVDFDGIVYDLIYIPEVHVYNEIDESDTGIETETETETNDPNVDYNSAYEQGYRDALSQMSKTPLYNATVNGTIVIEDNGSVTSASRIEYKISNLTNKGGFALSNIKPLIDIVQENNPNSTVYLSELSITFDRQVVFTNDLVIFGTQSPILAINDTTNSEGYVSYYNPIITFKGKYDNGIYKDFDAFYFKYAPLDNNYGSESPFVYAMRISDTDWLGQLYKISFSDMIIDTNSQFLNSIIYIPYEAYIKLADAEAFGNINGWERGFEQGKQSPSNVSYQKGFEAGKLEINKAEYTRGYWDGVEAGDSLRNVILAPFDGISGVFHNMLSVNILGFELDDIIGAILLMLLVIWIGKKVI